MYVDFVYSSIYSIFNSNSLFNNYSYEYNSWLKVCYIELKQDLIS